MNSIRNSHIKKFIKSEKISAHLIKRHFFIFTLLLLMLESNYSQTDTIKNGADRDRRNKNIENENKNTENKNIPKRDTTILETEKRLYLFIETQGGLIIDRIDLTTGIKKRMLDLGNEDHIPAKKDSSRFRGHWSGIEVGLNGFMSSGFMLKPPAGYSYFDLNILRSWNITINFAQYSIPLIKNNFGLVTGLGLQLNSYFFKGNNSIQVNPTTGVIEEWHTEQEYNVKKSKFTTTYLTLPLLLECHIRSRTKGSFLYFTGGVVGGWNILSALKVKYEVDGNSQKLIKRGGDLKINNFRAGTTFQIGSKDKNGSSGFYATYYFTPLFEKDLGPKLYPFEAGIRIDF